MIQETTQRLRFKLPIDLESVAALNIAFSQEGRVILEKKLDDCSIGGNTVVTWLSGDETAMFSARVGFASVQIRGVTENGYEFATRAEKFPVRSVLKRGDIE